MDVRVIDGWMYGCEGDGWMDGLADGCCVWSNRRRVCDPQCVSVPLQVLSICPKDMRADICVHLNRKVSNLRRSQGSTLLTGHG